MVTRRTGVMLLAALLLLAVPAAVAGAHRRHHHRGRRHAVHARHHHRHHGRAAANCATADTLVTTAPRAEMRAAVLCLINDERTSRGLPALRERPSLDRSAQLWTNTMVGSGLFSHGSDFAARITAAGYHWSYAGENIATGYQTPREAVNAWMASDGHCRNILDPHYADVGTGVSSQVFGRFGHGTWTQDFGLPSGHSAPSGNTRPQSGCPY